MNIKELSRDYIRCFEEIHEKYQFMREKAKKVSSRVDSSVFLVGSTISVLKPYLLDDAGCTEKRYLIQPAVRTQQLRNMEIKKNSGSCYGSFFFAMGNLSSYASLQEVFQITVEFLCEIFHKGNQRFMFRVSSKDGDLMECCRKYEKFCVSEVDSRPEPYYRHHYGLNKECIFGRNCNIAVSPTPEDEYKDIGNIIVIERNGVPFAVELAVGLSPLICHAFGLEHTMKGNIVADLLEMKDVTDYWLGDCLSVVACLEYEDVKINSSHMQGRLLKRYRKVMDVLCGQKNISKESGQELLIKLKSDYAELLNMLI